MMARIWSSPLVLGLAVLANAAHFDVTVGKGTQLKFDPETLTAQVGDTVTYSFFSKNHAVAQSTFDNPCQLQENGIFSAFTPNMSPDVAAPTTFTITVNDTKPLWFYCPQTNGNHCQSGMVHSINAPASGNTFEAYKAKAQRAATPSTPAVGTPPTGGLRKLHIDVGMDKNLVFNPSNVTEPIGTVVEFGYNPANHSIVQSSFGEPCQPLKTGGFAAPFFATQQAPSGVTFEVTVTNQDPVWFYCAQNGAQPAKTHCQAGMVGSINAPAEGNTFDAFRDLASRAGLSNIPPNTPLVGGLRINGTLINNVGSAVLNATQALDPALAGEIPAPGSNYNPIVGGMAGGEQPAEYGWTKDISDEVVEYLQALQSIDNVVVAFLLEGYSRLADGGDLAGAYPESITRSLGSLAAQSLIHRRTYTDTLQHYSKDVVPACSTYETQFESVDEWLETVLEVLSLSIGANIDVISLVAASKNDESAWLVPALVTALGAQTRMAALLNLMQNHASSPAPREVLIPYQLARSYVVNRHGASCGEDTTSNKPSYPPLEIKDKSKNGDRVSSVTVEVPDGGKGKELWIGWIGAWGAGVVYSSVNTADGTAAVPEMLSGHVWAVLTSSKDVVKAGELETVAVAGPVMVWTSQPWSV